MDGRDAIRSRNVSLQETDCEKTTKLRIDWSGCFAKRLKSRSS